MASVCVPMRREEAAGVTQASWDADAHGRRQDSHAGVQTRAEKAALLPNRGLRPDAGSDMNNSHAGKLAPLSTGKAASCKSPLSCVWTCLRCSHKRATILVVTSHDCTKESI